MSESKTLLEIVDECLMKTKQIYLLVLVIELYNSKLYNTIYTNLKMSSDLCRIIHEYTITNDL